METLKPIVICGPTACGKSALALALAQKINAVIINADSQQVYREIPILSNQPSAAEKLLVPHHLFGEIKGEENFNVAIWLKKVEALFANLKQIPIIVGGTGMYLNALFNGLSPIPEIPAKIRERVRKMEKAELIKALGKKADGNTSRMRRALEVRLATGKDISAFRHKEQRVNDYTILNLIGEREALYKAINSRFVTMMKNGAVEEVKALLKLGYAPTQPVMKAIGIAEIKAYLEGKISKTEAIEKAQQASRNYAKRQMTWFRHQLPAHKIDIANLTAS